MNLLSHFSRITSAGRSYIPQLDGLRFIGLLAVIAYHTQKTCLFKFGVTTLEDETVPSHPVNQVIDAGAFSVLMFFTMSGFILAVPFARQYLCAGAGVGLKSYYWRRVTRVEPPYMIHLVFLLLLTWAVLRHLPSHPALYHNDAWASYTLKQMTPSFFYSYGFVFAHMPYPNKVLWSLETEIQFYIVAPLMALLFRIPKMHWRRTVLVGAIIASAFIPYVLPQMFLNRVLLAGNLQFFLSGFLLADLYLVGTTAQAIQHRRSWFWDLMLPVACAGVVLLHWYPVIGVIAPWLSLLICLAAFQGTLCSKVLSNPWITTLGGMCYTVYMYHWFIISAVVRVTGGWQTKVVWLDLLIQILIMTPIIFLISAVFFFLFERPFMQRNWPSRTWAAIRAFGKGKPAPKLANP